MRTYGFNPSGLGGLNVCVRRAISSRFIPQLISAGYDIRPDGKTIAPVAGTILHEAVAFEPQDRRDWIEGTGLSNLLDREIQQVVDGGGMFEWDDTTPDIDKLKKQVSAMALAIDSATQGVLWKEPDRWLKEQAVNVDVTDIVANSIPLNEDEKIYLRGRFDFYDKQENQLIDIKTGKAYAPSDAGIQLACYRALLTSMGESPVTRSLIFYVRRHAYTSRTPDQLPAKIYAYETAEYMKLAQTLLIESVRHARTLWANDCIDPERLPANPSAMLCSGKFCRLHGTRACKVTKEKTIILIN